MASPENPCRFKFQPFESLTNLMHLLQNRLCMLSLRTLALAPRDVSGLADALGLEQSAASYALGTLLSAGILVAERHGQRRVYAVNPDLSITVDGELLDVVLKCRTGEVLHFTTAAGKAEPQPAMFESVRFKLIAGPNGSK